MAEEVTLGGNGSLFVGEDKQFDVEVLEIPAGSPAEATLETHGVPKDITGYALTFDVRTSDHATTALLSVAATITGTFNATRATNTQRARITLTDTQTSLFTAKTYRYSLKRTTDGSETVILYGDFRPQRATQT